MNDTLKAIMTKSAYAKKFASFRGRWEADDVTQSAALAFLRLRADHAVDNPDAMATACVKNAGKRMIRDDRAAKRTCPVQRLNVVGDAAEPVSLEPSPDHWPEVLDEWSRVRGMMGRLNTLQRSVVMHLFFDGLSVKDTASTLGIGEKKTHNTLARALALLRKQS